MTARLPTRLHSAAAEADIHGVQVDRQAKTSRRRRFGGKDRKQCLLTPSPTQSHSQKQIKIAVTTEVKAYDTQVGTVWQ